MLEMYKRKYNLQLFKKTKKETYQFKRGEDMKRKTGLKVGYGRWAKDLCEGDTVITKNGQKFKIKYQKEWAAFMADEKGGMLLYLAQNERWNDGTKLDISEVKILNSKGRKNISNKLVIKATKHFLKTHPVSYVDKLKPINSKGEK